MEYWVESLGQNPTALGPIVVVVVAIVVLIGLLALTRFSAGRKGLEKDRLALDAELYGLEKYASLKKEAGDKESRAESFWPKQDSDGSTPAESRVEDGSSDLAQGSQPAADVAQGAVSPTDGRASDKGDDEEDEFADIRRENLVRDWNEND